jgi:hypothetical protein
MDKTIENTNKLLKFISEKFESEELNNESLVQIIELSVKYLNLKTISNYSKDNKISYNGAKRFRKHIKIDNVKFIINNE